MDRASMKTHAKEQIKGKIFTLLAIYIIVGLVSGLIGMVLGPLGGIATLLITGSITLAESFIFLGITNKSRMPKIEDLLFGFKDGNFMRSFIGYLRMVIFTALWSLLFWIPGIIKGIAYSQMFYLMAEDKNLEPGEAQKKSMALMEGHKWEYFVLQLSFIPWYILGGITFGLAFIWIAPYVSTTFAEYHVRLVEADKPSAKIKAAVKAKVKEVKTKKA